MHEVCWKGGNDVVHNLGNFIGFGLVIDSLWIPVAIVGISLVICGIGSLFVTNNSIETVGDKVDE